LGAAALAGLLLAAGCATVETGPDFKAVQGSLPARPGPELIWRQSQADEARARQLVERALAGGLGPSEAAAVALLNNRALQAAFEEIGVSKAQQVQAGLFSNPTLAALIRFPVAGQESATNLELAASFKASELWLVPLRRGMAEAGLQRATLEVAQQVLLTRHAALAAWLRAYYAGQIQERLQGTVATYQELAAASQRRREFGYMTELDVYLARDALARARLRLAEARMEQALARAHLARVLGLGERAAEIKLAGRPPAPPQGLPALERAVTLARAGRLDLRLARARIAEAQRGLSLQRASVVKDLRLGLNWERETSGSEVLGPLIETELPVFDQNQAGIAQAQYLLRRAQKRLLAKEGEIREQVAVDLERLRFAQHRQRVLEEQVIPLRSQALAFGQKWAQLMQMDRVILLVTRRQLEEARLEQVQAGLAAGQALNDLELHLGGRLP